MGLVGATLSILLPGLLLLAQCSEAKYYGTLVGNFQDSIHGVQGEVYAVDSRTLFIKGFSYDGLGPDAYFYGGNQGPPSGKGFHIPNEKGSADVLGSYRRQNIVLSLPGGKTLQDMRWLSVWCRSFDVNFGVVIFPERMDYPRPQKIDSIVGVEHDVKSDRVVVVDAQTFLIPNFSYDGQAPDAYFWVGKGSRPSQEGTAVPDENGSHEPLKRYHDKTLVIVLPGELTIFDIDWISIWRRTFSVSFGSVKIPQNLKIPPSLRMLGIEPQTKLNCEILDESKAFEVRWAIAGKSIVTQLVARLKEGDYMAFGLSGDPDRTKMVGGDVTVAWMDHATGQGFADDYFLGAKSQCAGGSGSCPDANTPGGKNNVRLLNSAIINDFTMLTYRQPLSASDNFDSNILTNQSQPVIWAIGPVNSKNEISYHSKRIRSDLKLNFGRTPEWNCPLAGSSDHQSVKQSSRPAAKPAAPKASKPWFIPPIKCHEPEDGVFFAQIGPTGGEQGYSAITGQVGWGIAWYVNGLLAPEIYVVRGKTYTFVVEGGQDPESPAKYHPFYITDDREGGYQFKTPEEKSKARVFAGVKTSRFSPAEPTGTGRLCEWKEDPQEPAHLSSSFGAYQRTLSLQCQQGQPGILQWTPDASTPDLVYYQCFTHRFLGWKIHVLDNCDQ